ncbi:unnamed protein product [Lactuca saligna]|uniref:Uncharacterized protein n=1 Tax=Lactuca saligna TaxID=75948 RepID=A0AA35ZUV0_LACSI|nr:unnamed protein product [Lactuca saligna]
MVKCYNKEVGLSKLVQKTGKAIVVFIRSMKKQTNRRKNQESLVRLRYHEKGEASTSDDPRGLNLRLIGREKYKRNQQMMWSGGLLIDRTKGITDPR